MSAPIESTAATPVLVDGINPIGADGLPKTAKQIENEKKKAEKLAKFAAKQAAKSSKAPKEPKEKKEAKPAAEPIPAFVDRTVPGEKKILVSLDDPALKAYNPEIVESSWYAWWESQGFFEPEFAPDGSIKPEGVYVIPAPPPNVTGALHIGHGLTIAIQDALIRYNRMKGKTTLFIPGFDHAGISTQSVVEKMLWAKEKKTRHDLGREDFVKLIWEWKDDYHMRIKNQLKRLGASYDWEREAFTLDETRSKAVIETFVRLHDDGTIYRASRLVNWCVHLNTTLSNLEVHNKEIEGFTMIDVPGYEEPVQFGVLTSFAYPVEDSDEKLIVATTRPETLFGDTAVAIHPKDPRYTHLHGKFVLHPLLDRRIPIVLDDEAVDMEFGTGAVKITPAHDLNDYNTGKRHNLEFINILNDNGTLNETCGEYEGLKRFDARRVVIEKLKELGLYVGQEANPMSVPVCEKSGDVIEPLLKPQWWVSQKQQAVDALKAVQDGEIKITPKTSEAEFNRWLGNIQDWCISRQLWWGHRCPVYFVNIEGQDNEDKSDESRWIAGRTEEEAFTKATAKFPNTKFTLEQDEDVLDTWFSSGLWPLSTLGWPDKTDDMKNFYPMQLLETGWDILFFWVARMIMLSMKMTGGEIPFTEVFCHSLVRDAQGRKMSKSLGNVIDPLDVIAGTSLSKLHAKLTQGNLDPKEVKKAQLGQEMSFPNGIPECGTDALRFALCAYTTGGRDINLDILRVEGYRKFCNKIYQATKFALMRLGDDYVPPAVAAVSGQESLVEKWILHKFTMAAKVSNESLDNNNFMDSTNAQYVFWLNEFCDVYIENSKSLILDGTPAEVKSARDTLYTCLEGALLLIHPFMPYLTEELWQRIPRRPLDTTPSIVKASYPVFQESFYNPAAETAYDLVLETVKAARSLFSNYNILKNGKIYIQATSEVASTLEEQKSSILSLVKAASDAEFLNLDTQVPEGCVVFVVNPECSVYVLVKGQVDLEAEITRANGKIAKLDKIRAGLIKSMNVQDYETKVRQEVRDQNDAKLEGYNAEIDGLEAMVKEFQRLGM